MGGFCLTTYPPEESKRTPIVNHNEPGMNAHGNNQEGHYLQKESTTMIVPALILHKSANSLEHLALPSQLLMIRHDPMSTLIKSII